MYVLASQSSTPITIRMIMIAMIDMFYYEGTTNYYSLVINNLYMFWPAWRRPVKSPKGKTIL